jgi:putative ABC transport system permease protein
MTLVVASGLLLKDFSRLSPAQAGFRVDHVLILGVDTEAARYSDSQVRAFYRQLLERVRGLPGVRSAALGEHVPLGFSSSTRNIVVEGFQMQPGQRNITVQSSIIDDRFLSLLHIPLVRGRMFAASDVAAAPKVAMVNETMAQQYLPNRDAIGKRIQLDDKQVLEVVGIVKTIKYKDISEPPLPFLYMPLAQQYSSFMTLHV